MPRLAKVARRDPRGRAFYRQIFVAYAHEDREVAQALVKGLDGAGFRVFWDRLIPVGANYSVAIERALREARCVIVIWSKKSVTSDWVTDEANEGLKRRVLIPVASDSSDPPLGFRRLQACSIEGLSVDEIRASPPADLLDSIKRLIGRNAK